MKALLHGHLKNLVFVALLRDSSGTLFEEPSLETLPSDLLKNHASELSFRTLLEGELLLSLLKDPPQGPYYPRTLLSDLRVSLSYLRISSETLFNDPLHALFLLFVPRT